MNHASRPHYSLAFYAENPLIEFGDLVRTVAPCEWVGPAGMIVVPAGTMGEVEPFASEYGFGTAFRFRGLTHPKHGVFPMAMHAPGRSRYSNRVQLIRRRAVESAPYEPRTR